MFELSQHRKGSIRRWNPTAIACYKIGCRCSQCHILDGLELPKSKCRMKYAVLELVRKFGAPKELKNKEDIKEND